MELSRFVPPGRRFAQRTPDQSPERNPLAWYAHSQDPFLPEKGATPERGRIQCPKEIESSRSRSATPEERTEYAWSRIRTPSPEALGYNPNAPIPLALSGFLFPDPAFASKRVAEPTRDKVEDATEKELGGNDLKEKETTLSQGSMGHPYSCGEACKYAMKARGCKDGEACPRCHLCQWKKSDRKRASKDAKAAVSEQVPPAELPAASASTAPVRHTTAGPAMPGVFRGPRTPQPLR
eukprot:TRINITY_DN54890_c0_g1_i1.p1 TRINITY_DN54890_c0_g1~~TRINITY_DN54890_c0_g1_i1.p1  ORF type:complete len:237 (-),score=37.65 TRINITY_DN54890_c0_g1_i1:122-832(-)